MIKPSEENDDPIMINKNKIFNIGHVLSRSEMKYFFPVSFCFHPLLEDEENKRKKF